MTAPCVYNKHPGDTPADAIYFGRGSSYGNRFVIGEHGARDQVMQRFECEQLSDVDVSGLIGKSVDCFCYPNPCRGDLLIAKANFRVVVFGGRMT